MLDSVEFNILGKIQCVMNPDCDGDALRDSLEVDWYMDSDGDGKLNFVDADSDNDGVPVGLECLYYQNTDSDGLENMVNPDADDDGLQDSQEIVYGAYPELKDSDCLFAPCTPSWDSTLHDTNRVGAPGTGDGIPDGAELAAWLQIGLSATVKYDGDAYPSNLLDPDSDNDGLLDGEEFLLGKGQVRPDLVDTDFDGLLDGSAGKYGANDEDDTRVDADFEERSPSEYVTQLIKHSQLV